MEPAGVWGNISSLVSKGSSQSVEFRPFTALSSRFTPGKLRADVSAKYSQDMSGAEIQLDASMLPADRLQRPKVQSDYDIVFYYSLWLLFFL